MKRALVLAALACAVPSTAHAFCGFYVEGSGEALFNDATQVVLMRMGTRTVLSMQNNYKGPAEDFAMVIPVPVVLHEEDVKTLTKDVFAKVDGMGAPRLVEYWEQDPCMPDPPERRYKSGAAPGDGKKYDKVEEEKDLGVTIEAQFVVGEYQIVILSAKDSTGLDTWLGQEGYKIPPGAEPLLRPYVDAGSKFFVAKVDPKKVTFDADGRAALSPLRFHYDADEFVLPIRLGLANSSGKQDLIVTILSPDGRYEAANYDNTTIPTNLEVKDEVRTRFGEFYNALFDRTVEKHPGAVVTEYAWAATSCDPCPGPQLDYHDLATLGSDVLAAGGKAYDGYDFTMTRLHARYGKDDVRDDLVFKKTTPIVGGREFVVDAKTGKLEEGAQPDQYQNNFQGRYAIRHEWTGPIDCKDPRRNRWGGPPGGAARPATMTGTNLAFAPRGQVQLASFVTKDVPEIDLEASGDAVPPVVPVQEPIAVKPSGAGAGTASASEPASEKKKSGCGCASSEPASFGLLTILVLGLLRRRTA